MTVTTGENGAIHISKVFNAITLDGDKGERAIICQRDGGFEICYNNTLLKLKGGGVAAWQAGAPVGYSWAAEGAKEPGEFKQDSAPRDENPTLLEVLKPEFEWPEMTTAPHCCMIRDTIGNWERVYIVTTNEWHSVFWKHQLIHQCKHRTLKAVRNWVQNWARANWGASGIPVSAAGEGSKS